MSRPSELRRRAIVELRELRVVLREAREIVEAAERRVGVLLGMLEGGGGSGLRAYDVETESPEAVMERFGVEVDDSGEIPVAVRERIERIVGGGL